MGQANRRWPARSLPYHGRRGMVSAAAFLGSGGGNEGGGLWGVRALRGRRRGAPQGRRSRHTSAMGKSHATPQSRNKINKTSQCRHWGRVPPPKRRSPSRVETRGRLPGSSPSPRAAAAAAAAPCRRMWLNACPPAVPSEWPHEARGGRRTVLGMDIANRLLWQPLYRHGRARRPAQ